MSEGRFLTGGTMGHVVRMTATGAMGITFVFLVDAAADGVTRTGYGLIDGRGAADIGDRTQLVFGDVDCPGSQ